MYKCAYCESECDSALELAQHLSEDHGDEIDDDDDTDAESGDKKKSPKVRKSQAKKRRKSGNDQQFRCENCGYTTRFNGHMQRHKRKHQDDRVYQCQKCPFTFNRKSFYEKHLDKAHKNNGVSDEFYVKNDSNKFECKECDLETGDKVVFLTHVETFHEEKILARFPFLRNCAKCAEFATRLPTLYKHHVSICGKAEKLVVPLKMFRLDDNGLFRCPRCSFASDNNLSVADHMDKEHDVVFKFACELCDDFKTDEKDELINHKKKCDSNSE